MTELHPLLAEYVRRHFLLVPCPWWGGEKRPLLKGGLHAASNESKLIASWWQTWPFALVAIRTGGRPAGSGVIVIDIDIGHGGFNTLAKLIGPQIPVTPRVQTPSGGMHLWSRSPRHGCVSTDGVGGKRRRGLGPGLDVKGDLRTCHCPGPSPLSRYNWDPKFSLDVPLLPLPPALIPVEVPGDEDELVTMGRKRPIGNADAYAESAVRKACQRIRETEPGRQRQVLNSESYALGRLAAGLDLDRASIVRDLVAAGLAMQQQAGRPPWRVDQVRQTVLNGLRDGLRRPNAPRLRYQQRSKK
jgi:hypothetical protein